MEIPSLVGDIAFAAMLFVLAILAAKLLPSASPLDEEDDEDRWWWGTK